MHYYVKITWYIIQDKIILVILMGVLLLRLFCHLYFYNKFTVTTYIYNARQNWINYLKSKTKQTKLQRINRWLSNITFLLKTVFQHPDTNFKFFTSIASPHHIQISTHYFFTLSLKSIHATHFPKTNVIILVLSFL